MSAADSPVSAGDSSPADTPVGDAGERASRLRQELERAIEHADKMQAELDEMLADPEVIQEDRDAAARSLEFARGELASVRSALERLDDGAYGRCASCGGDIGEERLAALVDVTTCVHCAG